MAHVNGTTEISRRTFLKGSAFGLAGLALGGLAGCTATASTTGTAASSAAATSSEKVLNAYTWQGYIPPDVVTRFENETGIKINYSYFSTAEEMLAKLEATKGADYDVVITADYSIDLANREGLLQRIDTSRIPNIGNVDPRLQNTWYDPNNDLSIPYWINSRAILYDPSKTNLTFASFADLADSSLAGNVALTDGERSVIGTALSTLGYDYNTSDVSQIEQSESFLSKLRPNIKVFDTDGPEFHVSNGDCIASFHTGAQAIAGLLENPNLKSVKPKECSAISIDALAVPSQAPHLDNVYTFLNFELDPSVVALAVAYTHYYNSNLHYLDLVGDLVANNEIDIIPDSILDSAEFQKQLTDDAQKKYDEIWTAFKG